MFQDFISSLRLAEVEQFMLAGQPSMLVQLLGLNTILMMYLIVRRLRGVTSKRMTLSYSLQFLLVFTNLAIFSQEHWKPYVEHGQSVFTDRYHRVMNQ